MSAPTRYVVELRLPKKGERYLTGCGDVMTAHGDHEIYPYLVIVEPC